ncbi:MAG: PQQ-like beta-propeller repeat protein [Alphaproteobacteria bacterium]|nr:PQQ-like beta-propeller repeat protein [Alphaproteobacteria bacterium]
MKKIFLIVLAGLIGWGCSKQDPILPGVRQNIFEDINVKSENKEIPELSKDIKNISGDSTCDYRQDSMNNIWRGDKKVFSGFATDSFVKNKQSPICEGGFIYTGLTTGEVIKLNSSTQQIVWVADVFRASNLMGGASVVDIVAHVGVDKNFVYAGGLGDSFCKLNKYSGDKIWCLNISVPVDFIMVDDYAFVVGTDNMLYAINTKSGNVYWKAEVKKQIKPGYDGTNITVGKQRINYKTGK